MNRYFFHKTSVSLLSIIEYFVYYSVTVFFYVGISPTLCNA
ncbi:Uncharacterized protein dnm_096700 [Desulfonema magnum]|uniref:Uncharacterized protein n=1 Tax=Desulfonema magnum TaxID=45655 RepID=A0A975GU14_9BACT|nr:Uncharacterized protein dnm_096700 [Desulfonema magnum]